MHENQACARGETTRRHLIVQGQQGLAGVQRIERYAAERFAFGDEGKQTWVCLAKTAATGIDQLKTG